MPRIGQAPQAERNPDRRPRAGRPRAADTHLSLLDGDRGCVERIRQGDEEAFQDLFRTFYDPLCRFVEGFVRRRAVAEELVQSLFLTLWIRRDSWAIRDTLRTYLYTTARNHALNHWKRERLFDGYVARTWARRDRAAEIRVTTNADTRLVSEEVEASVRRAIAALPLRYAPALQLRWEHGMTYAEIARILDLPVKTVETRVGRALRMLRPALEALRT
jgi:RNA polymerase sigma-70 factor (ECF subfamily)